MDAVQSLLIKMLRKNAFFDSLKDEELLEFSKLFKLDMAQKKDAIIIEWHDLEYIYILKKWKLLAKKANWLKSIVLWEIKEWEIFWEMSYFYKQPAMASVICESDTATYWKIPRKDFDKFLSKNPELKTKIMEILSEREKNNREKIKWSVKKTITSNSEENLDDIVINL